MRHATETHHSVGLVPAPTAPNSPRADRCANRSGAPGGRFGVARPVDGPPETARNGDALIPKAKATAGEPIRTSRMHAGESQVVSARLLADRGSGSTDQSPTVGLSRQLALTVRQGFRGD